MDVPQSCTQASQSDQSAQTQYWSAWHCLGQSATSSADPGSQGSPRHLACFATCLERTFWPPHFVQALHSLHWLQAQSCFSQAWLHSAASPLHGSVTCMALSQARPPFSCGVWTERCRTVCPGPQGVSQGSHSAQAPRTQSTGSRASQPKASGGVQACSSFMAPMQNLPSPRPCCWNCLDRCCRPTQTSAMDAQVLQGDHWLNWQSTLASHGTPTLQLACCTLSPTAGFPQWFASCFTGRLRDAMPPSQVAEHSPQDAQLPQTPSMQSCTWQGWVLQGVTSSLVNGSHGLPPFVGILATSRERIRSPPSQSQLQASHSPHSPHWQSTGGSQAPPTQASDIERLRLQPVPPGSAKWSM
mmetsp:Transcript_93011/g.272214  ORF Transcript_93011/g.272214 Transcript_93011/m.272214 type:complete len:357 (-) Transcript_93011:1232-2302(-)